MNLLVKVPFFLAVVSLITSCGSLESFKTTRSLLPLNENSKIYLTSLNCNTEVCHKSESHLHKRLKEILKVELKRSFSRKNSIFFVSEKDHADIQFYLISAFEGNIEKEVPRNVHLIVKDKKGELLQVGLAEAFSTPLTNQYISSMQVDLEFEKLIRTSIENHDFIAHLSK